MSESEVGLVKRGRRSNEELGLISKKIAVPLKLWQLLETVSELSFMPLSTVLQQLEVDIIAACRGRQKTMRMNPIFIEAFQTIKERVAEDEVADVDVSLLATSKAARSSGYEGVYRIADGQYVFHAKDPGTKRVIPQSGKFLTPEGAAWARYQHYKQHGLPYGKLEREVERLRMDPTFRRTSADKPMPDRWLRAQAIHHLANMGTILPDLSPEDRRWETKNPATDSQFESE